MTAEEIKLLLEKHEFVKYYDEEDEITYYTELAPFYKEFDNYINERRRREVDRLNAGYYGREKYLRLRQCM